MSCARARAANCSGVRAALQGPCCPRCAPREREDVLAGIDRRELLILCGQVIRAPRARMMSSRCCQRSPGRSAPLPGAAGEGRGTRAMRPRGAWRRHRMTRNASAMPSSDTPRDEAGRAPYSGVVEPQRCALRACQEFLRRAVRVGDGRLDARHVARTDDAGAFRFATIAIMAEWRRRRRRRSAPAAWATGRPSRGRRAHALVAVRDASETGRVADCAAVVIC